MPKVSVQIAEGVWRQERAHQVGVVRGDATPSWGNPGNHHLVLKGALTRGLCPRANSNLLCLQNHLQGPISSVWGVREVWVAHHRIARYGPSA